MHQIVPNFGTYYDKVWADFIIYVPCVVEFCTVWTLWLYVCKILAKNGTLWELCSSLWTQYVTRCVQFGLMCILNETPCIICVLHAVNSD